MKKRNPIYQNCLIWNPSQNLKSEEQKHSEKQVQVQNTIRDPSMEQDQEYFMCPFQM